MRPGPHGNDVEWYRSRDVASTLILVGAVTVAILFAGRYLPEGGPRITAWIVLFLATAALSPAPWVAPPAAVVSFLIAILLAPSADGGCRADQLCEPVSGSQPILLGSVIVVLSSMIGATVRSLLDTRRNRARALLEKELPP